MEMGKQPMKVAALSIENFRGIRSSKVVFRDHTVLVGPNNSGKTSIIEALALVLGRDRLVRDLTEHDFYGSNPQAVDRIKIVPSTAIDGIRPRKLGSHLTHRWRKRDSNRWSLREKGRRRWCGDKY
jgi:putative ATP-dependent endonuclease of OLD family